ncbi:MAG: PAS domain S-box protein [Desulfarculaceae bacterium]|nr:PAS domain S-box protein [Desulfarculaceae bacterium]
MPGENKAPMRLRTILMILSLLALVSTAVGGLYYYYSLQDSALVLARRRAAGQTEVLTNQISSFLSQNQKPARALASLGEMRRALADPNEARLEAANQVLDRFQKALDVDVCYLLNAQGLTIASSNRNSLDSFVGHNFSFRPYFKQAMAGHPAKYLALGTTSKKRGAYYSSPVWGPGGLPWGVAVIKAPIGLLETSMEQGDMDATLLVGPHDVIFSSSRPEWVNKTLWPSSLEHWEAIARTRQFGDGPWPWSGIRRTGEHKVTDQRGEEYLYYTRPVANFPGWQVYYFTDLSMVTQWAFKPYVQTTGVVVLGLCIFAGLGVYFLYRKASQEINRRRSAELELRRSEERYRRLYHKTPALLHSIDINGRLVNVSDYWAEAMGYNDQEVIGRRLTDFLTPESRRHAQSEVLPRFFRTGSAKDISYQFVKKNGEVVDVLLSAIAERDDEGRIVNSLAVLVDVTTLKHTEEELRQAQEKLSEYSRDLERQVRQRTREITSFMKYAPAVVYMKDAEGRYIMVNSRFEELFGLSMEEAWGNTVTELFPPEIAGRFRRYDQMVVRGKQPVQAEERIPQESGVSTYLSVRFPIINESGEVSRVCGIMLNITDLKKAQERLRLLSGSIMESQEKERRAIARELHDELGQVLTALRIDAVWLRQRLSEADPKAGARADTMCALIDQTISEVRGIATRLRPPALEDLGLADALEWHTSDFEKRTGIACVFSSNGLPEVEDPLAIATYRVAQEALTNVARHSGATDVEVELASHEGLLELTVRDNGDGFSVELLSEGEELGIAGMRERAALAGGSLSIKSAPGAGTEVRLVLPLKPGLGESL